MAEEEAGFLYSRLGNATTADTAAAIAAARGRRGGDPDRVGHGGRARRRARARPGRVARRRRALGVRQHRLAAARPRRRVSGSTSTLVDTRDLDAVRAACAGGIAILLCETIANPGSVVADLDALAAIAHDAGGRLVVDSTVATPLLCRPLEHGADVVLHSATKFLNGHHDVLAGVVCGSAADVARVRSILIDTGGVADPEAAWLLRRGMRTLALRMERACANALAVARHLQARDDVVAVPYPGLPDHPQHALATPAARRAATGRSSRSRCAAAAPAASAS